MTFRFSQHAGGIVVNDQREQFAQPFTIDGMRTKHRRGSLAPGIHLRRKRFRRHPSALAQDRRDIRSSERIRRRRFS
ncbi:MAG TPA: hypothetical protein VII41_06860, partial [Steroidobacteraceae bacterium]